MSEPLKELERAVKEAESILGVDREVLEAKRIEDAKIEGAVEQICALFDDVAENLGLGHPCTALVQFAEDISPYNILTRRLGLPAPGDILDIIRLTLRTKLSKLSIRTPFAALAHKSPYER